MIYSPLNETEVYVWVNAWISVGSCNIMHNEQSEECIIHESIEYHELTDLHHGSVILWNKRVLYLIHLVVTIMQLLTCPFVW